MGELTRDVTPIKESTVGELREALAKFPDDCRLVIDPEDQPLISVEEEWSKSGLFIVLRAGSD